MVFAIWRIVALTASNVECTVYRMCLKSVAICRHAGQSQKPTASPSWMPTHSHWYHVAHIQHCIIAVLFIDLLLRLHVSVHVIAS